MILNNLHCADRYHHLAAQHAYEARVAAFGLPALLAPYTVKRPAPKHRAAIPAQRERKSVKA